MILTSLCSMSDDIQRDCTTLKNIILTMCASELPIICKSHSLTMEYKNREILLKTRSQLIGSIPFEIIYFEIKRNHLSIDDSKEKIITIIEDEIIKQLNTNKITA